jgi:hypothetical protein
VTVREGKVAIIGVSDDANRNRPLLELHTSLEHKLLDASPLELKYVLCIADRKREKLEIAQTNNWQKCRVCNNWICDECFNSFQLQSEVCVGSMFGFSSHEFT